MALALVSRAFLTQKEIAGIAISGTAQACPAVAHEAKAEAPILRPILSSYKIIHIFSLRLCATARYHFFNC